MPCLRLTVSTILAISVALADTPARPQFEVATVKLNTSGQRMSMLRPAPGGRLNVENMSLRRLLTFAYQVNDYQISGAPGWMDSDGYDIVARGEGNPTVEQIRLMLQVLLEDRFQLKVRRETKELPVYALLPAKGGPRLQEPKAGECVTSTGLAPLPAPGSEPPNFCGLVRMGPRSLNGKGIAMTQMVSLLSNIMGRTVVDKTGTTGTFNVAIEWTPDESTAGLARIAGPADPNSPPAPGDGSAASIFTVLQEKLGLKLESQKGPVDILVVDHAAKPTDN